MARAYSRDLRERVVRAEAAGLAPTEIERTLGISRRTLRRWHQRLAAGESLEPGQSSGRPRKIASHQEAALRDQVTAHPDATLVAHCTWWQETQGVSVSPATMCRSLVRIKWTLKKSPDCSRARSDGTSDVSGDDRTARSDAGDRPR